MQPELPLSQLAALGVARVSTGSLLFRTALGSITAAIEALVADGETASTPTNASPQVPSYAAVADLPLATR